MKQQIDNTVEKLKTDPFWAITVVDKDTLKNVERNATGEELSQKYGSVEEFFEHLKANGFTRLQIYDKKKNGSAFRALTDYAVTFVEKQAEPEPVPTPEPIAQAPIYRPMPMRGGNFGMNGLIGGLSQPEASFKVYDHARMQTEYHELKAENKLLQKEVEKLKEENLRNEILGTKSVESKKASAEMLKTFSESPVLAALASKLMPSSPPGLGMPDASLSPVKQSMIGIVHHADDLFVADLIRAAKGMSESDEFDTELTALFQKYNLTQE